jgi:hypothetical protein
MRTTLLTVLALLVLPAWVQAQTPVPPLPTSYTVRFNLEANPTGAPVTTYDFQKSAAVCNQAPTPVDLTTVVVNPRYIRFDDPAMAGRECVFDTGTAAGPLFALPAGRDRATLVGKVTQDGVELVSEASNTSNPFVRGAAPARPANVRVGGSL